MSDFFTTPPFPPPKKKHGIESEFDKQQDRRADGYEAYTMGILPRKLACPVGGFNPFKKYLSSWIISPNRSENKKYLKPPTSVPLMMLGTIGWTVRLSWWLAPPKKPHHQPECNDVPRHPEEAINAGKDHITISSLDISTCKRPNP